MKAKQFFTMALVAIIAIICIVAIGCKDEPDDPPPPQPVAQKWTVDLGGGKKVEVNYMAVTVDVPAYLSRLGPVFQEVAPGMPTAVYTINVEYDGTPYNGFASVGSKTLKVHNNWISSASDDVCFASLGDVFMAWTAMNKSNARETIRMAKAPVEAVTPSA